MIAISSARAAMCDRAVANLGAERCRRLDGRGRYNGRPGLQGGQQSRARVGDGMSPKVRWAVVRAAASQAGIDKLAPHDLRRTCARLCHLAGGELDQIQFLLGHVSIQTTERYLGCKQKLRVAVNDRLGIEPGAA